MVVGRALLEGGKEKTRARVRDRDAPHATYTGSNFGFFFVGRDNSDTLCTHPTSCEPFCILLCHGSIEVVIIYQGPLGRGISY
jgi:hypothetical protein